VTFVRTQTTTHLLSICNGREDGYTGKMKQGTGNGINAANPLIVQSDRTLLLDVHTERAEEARAAIIPFAELEKSPEHIHTYRITPLSLWNAASAGYDPSDIVRALNEYSRYQIPSGIAEGFSDTMARYGKISMRAVEDAAITDSALTGDEELFLKIDEPAILVEIDSLKSLKKYLHKTDGGFLLRLVNRTGGSCCGW